MEEVVKAVMVVLNQVDVNEEGMCTDGVYGKS